MELRQLQQFVVLAETLSFRKTAERLHISQPPLSISIKKLETELGVQLFERTTHKVSLTKAGQSVLELAKQILFNAQEFPKIARSATKGLDGELLISFVGTAKYSLLQNILVPFKSAYPNVTLRLHEDSNHGIISSLEMNEIDIGIIRTPLPVTPVIQYQMAERHEFLWALPTGHSLLFKEVIHLSDIKDTPVISYTEGPVPGLHAAVSRIFQEGQVTPNITHKAVQVETVIFLVSIGMGIALVPSCVAARPAQGVEFRKLAKVTQDKKLGLGIAYNQKYQTLAAQHFVALAKSLMDE